MRVTAETKELTRKRILEAARERFRATGFEQATTRDIAQAAGIATGTLFNYFPTKEAILAGLIVESQSPSLRGRPEASYESLEEALFAHVAETLRTLKPYRRYLSPLLETSLSPLASSEANEVIGVLRIQHLEGVVEAARRFQLDARLTPLALQMYWSLYLGVLAFWIQDKSPKQEDTLALLDQSIEMFVGWLRSSADSSPNS